MCCCSKIAEACSKIAHVLDIYQCDEEMRGVTLPFMLRFTGAAKHPGH
jgi:hypothetical protein